MSDVTAFEASSTAILATFYKVLGVVKNITKTQTADTGKYTYTYADLGDVVDECVRACREHGLEPTQVPTYDGERMVVINILLNAEGEHITFAPTGLPMPRDAQAYGSALTYLRRYSFLSIFRITPEDDDGRAATTSAQTQPGRRTEAERQIREQIGAMEPVVRAAFANDFKQHFGMILQDLPAPRHGDALTWSKAWKPPATEPTPEDAADAAWTAAARGEGQRELAADDLEHTGGS